MRMSRRMALYSVSQSIKTLNDSSWDEIYTAGANNTASSMWAIGDCKAVELSGTVGAHTFSGTYYCFIIAFNHYDPGNTTYGIDFQFGKSALTGGIDVAYVDTWYGYDLGIGFTMNGDSINSGGWASSTMCTVYCAQFRAVLPDDLKNIIGSVSKYTANTGGGHDYYSVTASTSYIWLLSEYEVFGQQQAANMYEQNYQTVYSYYSNISLYTKMDQNLSNTVHWWLRSPSTQNTTSFCSVGSGGVITVAAANCSFGFAPCFSTRTLSL